MGRRRMPTLNVPSMLRFAVAASFVIAAAGSCARAPRTPSYNVLLISLDTDGHVIHPSDLAGAAGI